MASVRRARSVALLLTIGAILGLQAGPAQAIVGGGTVPAGQDRFMAALLSDGSQICGGSVIASRWVLTAAHCVADGSAAGLSVSVGNVDYTAGTHIVVDQVVVHPNYDANLSSNDAALLHLAAGVPGSALAIRLSNTAADDVYELDGASVIVAGWGSTMPLIGEVPPLDSQLRQVGLTVVGDQSCSQDQDAATQVCAQALLKDSCQGDSGGPLFATTSTGPVQVGIVSYGMGCAIPYFPGVYSEVNAASIRNWIRTTTGV
jgi:trypsin